MRVKRRLTNMFMALVMLGSLASVGAIPERVLPNVVQTQVAQAAPVGSVKLGDYIQFGSYNDAPILWRVINVDANGNPVLFADRILTLKAFDAAGSYHPVGERRDDGSNYYPDSNIRQWLNSSSANSGPNTIDWIQNDPIEANMFNEHNPYNTEKGFLADGNFSATERSLIQPLTHKVLLTADDEGKKNGGTAAHEYAGDTNLANVMQNYDTTAYFQNVPDSVFLLSIKQLKEWVYDRGYDVTAKPTAEAVTQSTYQASWLNSDTNYYYWLNSPDGLMPNNVRAVANDGAVGNGTAYSGLMGVRPALQLNLSSFFLASGGTGTSGSPYTLTTEAPVKPGFQSLVLSSDAKQLTATFNAALSSSDSTKITIKNGSTTALPNTAFNTSVSQKSLVITLADSKATFKSGAKITIGTDAVTDSKGVKNESSYDLTLDTTKFVKLSTVTMNSSNTEATLRFATTGKSGALGEIELNPALSNLSGQVETSVDGGKTWSVSNVDSATVVDSTVIATFKSAITNSKTIIRVKAGALSYTATGKATGNLNSDVRSAALDLSPLGVSASLSANNKVLTVTYSEPIKSVSADLKGKVTLSVANPANYLNLEINDNVSIKGSSLIIALAAPLTSSTISVKVAAGGVSDAKNNNAPEYTTATLAADTTGPQISAISVGKDGKTATIIFNENITAVVTDKTKWGEFLEFSGNQGASYTPLTTPTVTVAKNTMTIKSAQSLAHGDRIKVKANAVQDVATVKNLDDNEMIDGQDPTAETTVVTSANRKQVVITFNEQLTTTARAQDNITVTSFLRSAISIKQGSATTFLNNKSMSAVTVQLSVNGSGKTVLTISNLPADLNLSDQIGIKAGTFIDPAQRRNVLLGLPVMAFAS